VEQRMAAASALTAELRASGAMDDTPALLDDTLFGVDQIKELVINLKNFSRLDQARNAEASLNDCLEQTLTIASSVLKNRVEIVRSYGDIPRIMCAPSQINQVLLNVMTNAAQAIEHDHGQLLLETSCDGDFVQVGIQDNGKGIAPENLKKIFDPFFTTKPVGQGTGLGLSISFQIIESHGGTISVSSEVGKGTRFVISLPVRAQVAAAA
ncbi:MAG TPA: ATP-binding protein, partial [Nevskiaceae bacterium]|nr:ATP-binding protein [Nevskiaceae bacterium]